MNPETVAAYSGYALNLVEDERGDLYAEAENLRELLDDYRRGLEDALLEKQRLNRAIEDTCDRIDVLDAKRLSLLDAAITLKKLA